MSAWQYGRSDPDPDTGGEKFINFAVWQKDRWQPEAVYPSVGILSHAHLHRYRGHPGGPKIATIARWTAPEQLRVVLEGTLRKASPKGNGVRARLVRNVVRSCSRRLSARRGNRFPPDSGRST